MEISAASRREVGRYSLYRELASGGMATVYLGRLNAAGGFGRIVAIKRLHAQLARDPEFVTMFLDEARLAARIHHPNVVATLDVVSDEGELFVVMEYVRGESLARLWRATNDADSRIPVPIASSIVGGLLHGLHAAHEATDERGSPLGIVHRDVSPQNVMVGEDGATRVLDFGVAKAASRLQQTREGQLKGKLGYMAPEQISEGEVTKRCDLYAAGIVLWETLTGRFLFRGATDGETLHRVLQRNVEPPSHHNPDVSPALDRVVLRALEPEATERYASAREMARELDTAAHAASALEVGEWVLATAAASLESRHAMVRDIESGSIDSLSGFPAIPEGALAAGRASSPARSSSSARLASPSTTGTEAKLVTAVTMPSVSTKASSRTGAKRWPWLAGLAGAAVLAGGLFVGQQFRQQSVQPATEPSSRATTALPGAELSARSASAQADAGSPVGAPAADSSSPSGGAAEPSSAVGPATSVSAAPSPVASASSAAPRSSSKPRPPASSGNDLDSLIENRR